MRAVLDGGVIGELLTRCADMENAAKAMVRELHRAENAAVRAAEWSVRADTEQRDQRVEQQRQEAEQRAARQALADRLTAVRTACDLARLTLDIVPTINDDGTRTNLYRVVTADNRHTLLPSEFDAAARASVRTFVRGGRRWFVLLEPTGLDRVTRWLEHHGYGLEGGE
ncbi:hypothetical protein [Nocardia fluminea]|uniref:hypothetical protein n=1 Tax=Nocardia fluminea TaxID=134984 RepID=UPI0034309DF9